MPISQIACEKCHRIIAEWDGKRLIIQRKGVPYMEFPIATGTIQCHHQIKIRGHYTACGHLNRIAPMEPIAVS